MTAPSEGLLKLLLTAHPNRVREVPVEREDDVADLRVDGLLEALDGLGARGDVGEGPFEPG